MIFKRRNAVHSSEQNSRQVIVDRIETIEQELVQLKTVEETSND